MIFPQKRLSYKKTYLSVYRRELSYANIKKVNSKSKKIIHLHRNERFRENTDKR